LRVIYPGRSALGSGAGRLWIWSAGSSRSRAKLSRIANWCSKATRPEPSAQVRIGRGAHGKAPMCGPRSNCARPVTDLDKAKEVPVNTRSPDNTVFSLGSEFRYVFAPHKAGSPEKPISRPSTPSGTAECLGHVPAARRFVCAGLYAGAEIR